MQPKGKGVAVLIGVSKPGGPPPLRGPDEKDDMPMRGKMQPPQQHDEPDADDQGGGKIGPEDVDYSDNDLCESCANMGEDGNCMKYGFPVDRTGHCEAGHEPKGDQQVGADQQQPGGDQGWQDSGY